jgi:hypothetical protein
LAVVVGTFIAIIVGGYLGLVAVSGVIASELSQINAGPNGIGKGLPEIVMVTIYGYGGVGLGAMIGGVLGLMLMLRVVRKRIVPWMLRGRRFSVPVFATLDGVDTSMPLDPACVDPKR